MNHASALSSALRRHLTLLALIGTAFASHISTAQAQALPTAKPETVGMSTERLNRVGDWMRNEVAQKRIPGATVLVVR